jgi:hypothetical protein
MMWSNNTLHHHMASQGIEGRRWCEPMLADLLCYISQSEIKTLWNVQKMYNNLALIEKNSASS